MILTSSEKSLSNSVVEGLIRTGLIAVLVITCYRVFHPFLDLMLWSVILAVTLYPLDRKLRQRVREKDGLAATLIVFVAIGILLVPMYLLGASVADSVGKALDAARTTGFHVRPPADSVAQWPVVGPAVHSAWTQASTDLSALTQKYSPQIRDVSFGLLGKLASFGLGMLAFIVALILAGIFMAYGESGNRSAVQIASRIVGPAKGLQIVSLCTSTIRSVAVGVIGIAFIQMFLIGIGFVMLGVPGAGLLSIAVLLLGIAQIPATLITLPVIIYVFASGDVSLTNILLCVYLFVAGLVDNVLKPILLGRGTDVPMPVVLIGALGGMVTKGVIGLFMGPVILAVGYVLFWQWVTEVPGDIEGGTAVSTEA